MQIETKNGTNVFIKQSFRYRKHIYGYWEERGRDKLGVWDWHKHTTTCSSTYITCTIDTCNNLDESPRNYVDEKS